MSNKLHMSLNELLRLKVEPGPYPTSLVERVQLALDTPLRDLSHEQIRVLISQQIGLDHILPLAMEILSETPLVATALYQGDLLCACLRISTGYWSDNPDAHLDLRSILSDLDSATETISKDRTGFERLMLMDAGVVR